MNGRRSGLFPIAENSLNETGLYNVLRSAFISLATMQATAGGGIRLFHFGVWATRTRVTLYLAEEKAVFWRLFSAA